MWLHTDCPLFDVSYYSCKVAPFTATEVKNSLNTNLRLVCRDLVVPFVEAVPSVRLPSPTNSFLSQSDTSCSRTSMLELLQWREFMSIELFLLVVIRSAGNRSKEDCIGL